jgi:hypothetical protein
MAVTILQQHRNYEKSFVRNQELLGCSRNFPRSIKPKRRYHVHIKQIPGHHQVHMPYSAN